MKIHCRDFKVSVNRLVVGALCVILAGCAHTPVRTAAPPAPVEREAPATSTAGESQAPATTVNTIREPFIVTLRYLETGGNQTLIATENLVVTTPDQGLKRLPAGTWRVAHRRAAGAAMVYPVYVKAFGHNEIGELNAERQVWRDQGYATFVTTMGRSLKAATGAVYDSRKHWLGIKRCGSEGEANALKKTLQGQKVWGWTRAEVHEPTQGTVSFLDEGGRAVLSSPAPLRIRSTGVIALDGARAGKAALRVPGPLELSLNLEGDLSINGELPLESYLQGILPAEMYPDWPLEALKAQAVAARSEVIAHAAGKHYFDGYDFCIEQHCRAFAGDEGRHARTDQAVLETAGQVLIGGDNAIVPTVFSANCGGWTENNENVWDGAPAAELRGHSDRAGAHGPGENRAVETWIASTPPSHCAHDGDYYRWSRNLSLGDLSKRLDSRYGIGSLKQVEPLERGVSGRLKAVRLVGSRKSEIVRKELNIRQSFDNLPSALCTINVDQKSGTVRVRGAGRGHGVGLCQQGACGMARANERYDSILYHYFTGVKIAEI